VALASKNGGMSQGSDDGIWKARGGNGLRAMRQSHGRLILSDLSVLLETVGVRAGTF